MRILITGADGFIGKNLVHHLAHNTNHQVLKFCRGDKISDLKDKIHRSDIIVHLAAVNRTNDSSDFIRVNKGLTEIICEEIEVSPNTIGLIFTSSLQSTHETPYGKSKHFAESAIKNLCKRKDISATIYRLPGVFGKWCKPNYNNVVATFCHNIIHNNPIEIHDPDRIITFVYIDDVIKSILGSIDRLVPGLTFSNVAPEFEISLDDLAKYITYFKKIQNSTTTPSFNNPIIRPLHSTYLSYLPIEESSYQISGHSDERGLFLEVMRLPNSGQISCIKTNPGMTRGGHFHHSKVEKFLVVKGSAKFRFLNVLTNEKHEITTSESTLHIVQTLPGWSHDFTNTGNEELIVLVWSNEEFDPTRPDTIKVNMP